MPELTLQNIDQIIRDVKRQEITFSHLLDELTDHLCCDVEYEMLKGLSFQEAYQIVNQKMGKRRLKEIQEETLYAVDTKYRNMKNTMKISGIVGTVLLGFAALFKIMHWPFAGVMMVLGAFTLALVFMPSALGVLWKETHSGKRLFLYISAFVAGMLFILGSLFKIQHWPGAGIILGLAAIFGIIFFIPTLLISKLRDQGDNSKRIIYILGAAGLICYILGLFFKVQHWPLAGMLLIGGLAIILFVVFPWYTWLTWKDDNNVSVKFIFMVIGSLAIVVPSALVSLNLQRNFDKGYFIQLEEQQAMFNYLNGKTQSFLKNHNDSVAEPVLIQIQTRTSNLLQVINGIESNMIAESEGSQKEPAAISQQISQTENGPVIQYALLKDAFNYDPVTDFLMTDCSARKELDSALKEYSDFLSRLIPGGELRRCEKLLDPSAYLPEQNNDSGRMTMMNGLHKLGLLKNSILTVESNAFLAVSKH